MKKRSLSAFDQLPKPIRNFVAAVLLLSGLVYYPFTQLLPRLLFNSNHPQLTLVIFSITSLFFLVTYTVFFLWNIHVIWPLYEVKNSPRFKKRKVSLNPELGTLILMGLIILVIGGNTLPNAVLDFVYPPKEFIGSCWVEKKITSGPRSTTVRYFLVLDQSNPTTPTNQEVDWHGIYITNAVYELLTPNPRTGNVAFPCTSDVSVIYFPHLQVLWEITKIHTVQK